MTYLIKYKLIVIGLIAGAIGGYLYYHFIGCAGGTCMITSRPMTSTLYGALMGGLFFDIFRTKKQPQQ